MLNRATSSAPGNTPNCKFRVYGFECFWRRAFFLIMLVQCDDEKKNIDVINEEAIVRESALVPLFALLREAEMDGGR